MAQPVGTPPSTNLAIGGRVRLVGLAVIIVVILVALTLLIVFVIPAAVGRTPELEMGSIIVLSVLLLFFLLFLVAVGFSALGTSNPAEAFGLPTGSVRALIALLLLLMFVFFTLYLFGQVAVNRVQSLDGLTAAQVGDLGASVIAKVERSPGVFSALVRIPVPESTERFASQIFTATATLVTAVASFYFGSRVRGG